MCIPTHVVSTDATNFSGIHASSNNCHHHTQVGFERRRLLTIRVFEEGTFSLHQEGFISLKRESSECVTYR